MRDRRAFLKGAAALAAYAVLPSGAEAAKARLLMHAGKSDRWSPHVLSRSVLRAWWCADDHGTGLMTDDGAGLISLWTDRISGMGAQGATTQRPTYGATAFAGALPGVTFDASANTLFTLNTTGLPTGTASSELWAVAEQSGLVADTTIRYALSYGSTVANGERDLGRTVTSGVNRFRAETLVESVIDTAVNFSGPHVFGAAFDFTAHTIIGRIDGAATIPSTGALVTANTGTTRVRIGTKVNGGTPWNGAIRHAIIISGLLSAVNRQRLEGWLAWDSGLTSLLPASHPYKSVRP